jgi:hypothetical protein
MCCAMVSVDCKDHVLSVIFRVVVLFRVDKYHDIVGINKHIPLSRLFYVSTEEVDVLKVVHVCYYPAGSFICYTKFMIVLFWRTS